MKPTQSRIIYKSTNYSPERVTGRYVRVYGKAGAYVFRVSEVATNEQKNSAFFGQPGMGYTIREYQTTGVTIPEEIKQKAIETKTTVRWD